MSKTAFARVAAFDHVFEHAIGETDTIRSVDDLQNFVKSLLDPYGLEHATYHAVKIPGRERSNPVLALTYKTDWIKHYISEDYFQIDPVVIRARESVLPVDWEYLDKSPPRVRKLFCEARQAGVGIRGLSLPVRGPAGDVALFSITSNASEKDWVALKQVYMRDFQMIANFTHARVMEILGVGTDVDEIKLSPRERECLQWAAMGKTTDEIGGILTISERTVRFFLDGAKHKLGCVTKTQAVARAASLRLISV
jgi:DNA-binding CsgD family transcriptional regulator